MKCKQGDLAIIVKSHCGNEGKIVRCVKFVGDIPGWNRNDLWELDQDINAVKILVVNGKIFKLPYLDKHIPDEYLRPIRDEDGEDEMLTIAGKPQVKELEPSV